MLYADALAVILMTKTQQRPDQRKKVPLCQEA